MHTAKSYCGGVVSWAALLVALGAANPSYAQTASQVVPKESEGSGLEEIVVTARKRDESVLRAPVILDVFTPQQIDDFRITDFYQLAAIEPDLTIGTGFSTVGAIAILRGLGNGLGATFVDQSVLLNIDGQSMSQGQFYKTGLFDVGQIEVLKGPQSLFFGKSSSAGIIAVHSADPTDTWEAKASAGYEFAAQETPFEAYISGPLTDQLGIRVAGYYSQMKGWLTDPNPYNPDRAYPDGDNEGGRVTLKFDSGNGFRAKLKMSYGRNADNAFDGALNQRSCEFGHPQVQLAVYDNCKIDTVASGVSPSLPYNPSAVFGYGNTAVFNAYGPSPWFENGQEYEWTQTAQGVLNMEYDVARQLTLTSITAENEVTAQEAGRDFEPTPEDYLVIAGRNVDHNFSQEVRLTSSYTGWLNFMAGAEYDQSLIDTGLVIDIPGYTFLTDDTQQMTSKDHSFFGQLLLTPFEQWELSLGARYTLVHKFFTSLAAANDFGAPTGNQVPGLPYDVTNISQGATTPEATLTYRPSADVTAFLSYKQGYKGPGFNANSSSLNYLTPGDVSPFGGEKANGGEAGLKAALLDRHLALTASIYNYQYTGLQVAFVDNNTHSVVISPSANARVRGVELGAEYAPSQIQGLTFNAYANYNDSKYMSFPDAPCYGGQSLAAGCYTNAAGSQVQDLQGHRLNNAPPWTGRFGFSYRRGVLDNYVGTWTANSNFSSAYYYTPDFDPNGIQKSYITFDTSLHFGAADGRWEVALIGRDLFNTVFATVGQDDLTVKPGVPADALGIAARPRQVLLQVTVRPRF